MLRRNGGILVVALAAAGAIGCSRDYPCVNTTDTSSATLSGTAPDWVRPDGGEAIDQGTPFSFTAEASTAIASTSDSATPEGTCVWIQTGNGGSEATDDIGVGIGFDCVAGPGTYPLEDLHATACNSGTNVAGGGQTCGPISGTLTVRAFARPCGDGGCGHLDADLVVSSEAGAAITLSGQATLAYDQMVLQCHEPAVSYPGGG